MPEISERECRRFQLVRREDETGISGTGVVAEGIVFSDGHAAIHWTGSKWPTTTPHPGGIESVLDVHGHGGKTTLMWLDVHPTADYGSAWTELREHLIETLMKSWETGTFKGLRQSATRDVETILAEVKDFLKDSPAFKMADECFRMDHKGSLAELELLRAELAEARKQLPPPGSPSVGSLLSLAQQTNEALRQRAEQAEAERDALMASIRATFSAARTAQEFGHRRKVVLLSDLKRALDTPETATDNVLIATPPPNPEDHA